MLKYFSKTSDFLLAISRNEGNTVPNMSKEISISLLYSLAI